METFRDYLIESNSFYKKAKRFIKDKAGAQEYTFIAPMLKGVKQVETRKAYNLFVYWDEVSAYNVDKNIKLSSVLPSLEAFVTEQESFIKKQIKMLKDKITTESDDKDTFYKFVIGVGYKEDIDDFIKEKLKGAESSISKI